MSNNPVGNAESELTLSLKNYSDEQISIIIVHKDRPEYLNLTLQSICVTSFNSNYEIIVVITQVIKILKTFWMKLKEL